MTVTPTTLTRGAAAAAVAAGLIFIGVNINHPHLDIDSITTTELAVRNTLKILMCALAVAGISGMYLSQVRTNGVLGLVGYLVLCAGYLLIMSSTFVAAYVLPSLTETDPSYVEDVLNGGVGDPITGDIGALDTIFQLQGLCYLAGGLIFGIALFRAGVLIRWAAVLLAVGGLVSVALTLMPDAFYRLLAYPNGIAMVVLGYSLWRSQRQDTDQRQDIAETRPQQPAV